jgi:3-deoxy-D-manno-octulosonic-acid transferase
LINARLSPKSLAAWRDQKASGRYLFSQFEAILCADARTAATLSALRGERLEPLANLKLAAPAPAIDKATLGALKAEIGARPVWLAASTHEGEDEIALAAHEILRGEHPNALLVLAPRHPERGAQIADLACGAPRRALGQNIGAAPVYVADTLGEMGALLASAPIAFIGGSLLSHLKGHNPVEAARLGSSILTGPYVESFADLFAALDAAGGAQIVCDADSLAHEIALLWNDEAARLRRLAAAQGALKGGDAALQTTLQTLAALLPGANPATVSAHASA